MLISDTIAAISTAPGEGAVAVLRVSGPDARTIASDLLVFRGQSLWETPRKMRFCQIVKNNQPVDSGLAVTFPGPHSYTGEDILEIQCHGGLLVSAAVLEAVMELGARSADPGEFTRRAFLNGKMDLTQAEAVMDIIRARTPVALAAAEEQLGGRLGREMSDLRSRLLGLVANVEAWIDFPEEEIDPATGRDFVDRIGSEIDEIDALLSTAGTGRILREGLRVVICGLPNAGKSSLMNQLLGCDRSIVTATPGTTRDTIEELANLGGFPFRITDTAGLRETGDPVEQIGVARAREAIHSADLLLHVVDVTSESLPADVATNEIVALNKCDLLPSPLGNAPPNMISISCATGAGMEDLIALLVQKGCGTPRRPAALAINARHQACLHIAKKSLQEAADELENGSSPEYAASGLRSALDAIGEILGLADTEEILGAIFSTFCIGK